MILLDDLEIHYDSENNWQRFLKKKKKKPESEEVPAPSAKARKNSESSVDGTFELFLVRHS